MVGARKPRKATAKQQRFVELYLVSLDAAKCYREAYNYTGKNPDSLGYQQLRRPAVRKLLNRAIAARSKRTGVDADFVLGELTKVASTDKPDDEVKVVDKLRALEMLGKHLRLFADVVEHRGVDDLMKRLVEGRERTDG
ncbi:MAG: terminase small subunit [Actinomycetia bacterium]|nr:terminase small subunit [Actinomycetes bacterium]